jgi:hypothetical protein
MESCQTQTKESQEVMKGEPCIHKHQITIKIILIMGLEHKRGTIWEDRQEGGRRKERVLGGKGVEVSHIR